MLHKQANVPNTERCAAQMQLLHLHSCVAACPRTFTDGLQQARASKRLRISLYKAINIIGKTQIIQLLQNREDLATVSQCQNAIRVFEEKYKFRYERRTATSVPRFGPCLKTRRKGLNWLFPNVSLVEWLCNSLPRMQFLPHYHREVCGVWLAAMARSLCVCQFEASSGGQV